MYDYPYLWFLDRVVDNNFMKSKPTKSTKMTETIGNYIALLFLSRDFAHRAHLRATTHAQHIILQEFYERMTELADKLAEAYQGRHGIIDIPYLDAPNEIEPIAVISKFMELVEGSREAAIPANDRPLNNIVDEVVGQFLSSLYKLKNLK